MNPLYVGTSLFNFACLFLLVATFFVENADTKASLAAFAVVGGFIANLMALAITGLLVVRVVAAAVLRQPYNKALRDNWLGIINGVVVLVAWALFFAIGKLPS